MTKQKEFYKAIEKNDLKKTILLLKHEKVNPAFEDNKAIRLATKNNHYNVVKLLLKDHRVNPIVFYNTPMFNSVIASNYTLSALLWSDQRIKNTFKDDCPEIYDEFIKYYLQNNIESF